MQLHSDENIDPSDSSFCGMSRAGSLLEQEGSLSSLVQLTKPAVAPRSIKDVIRFHKRLPRKAKLRRRKERKAREAEVMRGEASSLLQMREAACYYYFVPCCAGSPNCPLEGGESVGAMESDILPVSEEKTAWEAEIEDAKEELKEEDEWDVAPAGMEDMVAAEEAKGIDGLEDALKPTGAMGGEHFGAAIGIQVKE